MSRFTDAWQTMAEDVHTIAVNHGWWEQDRGAAEVIALIHSELSEALEYARHGDGPSDHIPEYTGVEEELADAVIRIMDYAAHQGLRVAEALEAKSTYNDGRPYKHGKEF